MVSEAIPDVPPPGALQPHECHGTSAWDRKLPKHRPSLPFPPTLPECDNPYDTRYKPERLLIYDKHPGGIGLCAAVSMRGRRIHEGSKFTCQEKARAGSEGFCLEHHNEGCPAERPAGYLARPTIHLPGSGPLWSDPDPGPAAGGGLRMHLGHWVPMLCTARVLQPVQHRCVDGQLCLEGAATWDRAPMLAGKRIAVLACRTNKRKAPIMPFNQ